VAVTEPPLTRVLERLRASGFRDLAGARVTASLPVSEPLLNDIIADMLPRGGAVRSVRVEPQEQDRLALRVKLTKPDFLPPLSATLAIERQPVLPQAPQLVFRVLGLPGLLRLAGSFLSVGTLLPPGVDLRGDLLVVDLAALLAQHGAGDLLGYVERVQLRSDRGRLILEVASAVPPG
jgi:hypothetical protein